MIKVILDYFTIERKIQTLLAIFVMSKFNIFCIPIMLLRMRYKLLFIFSPRSSYFLMSSKFSWLEFLIDVSKSYVNFLAIF